MPLKDNYIEVQIEFDDLNYENICNELYITGVNNILEDEYKLKICFDESDFKLAEDLKIHLIINSKLNPDKIKIIKSENKDWNKEWEKTIEPVSIKDKIIVSPSWKKSGLKINSNQILIEIDPKMSFGTGHNETTQLILEYLADEIDSGDKYLLDYGCGTGILAIAGIKLGVNEAVAIDIDNDSIENAKEYFEINNVKGKIKLYNKNISEIEETGFDVICVNIIRSVIENNLGYINTKLKNGGKLFISGILNTEVNKLADKLTESKFIIEKITIKSEWAGIFARKK